jgi:hypothetical protein
VEDDDDDDDERFELLGFRTMSKWTTHAYNIKVVKE